RRGRIRGALGRALGDRARPLDRRLCRAGGTTARTRAGRGDRRTQLPRPDHRSHALRGVGADRCSTGVRRRTEALDRSEEPMTIQYAVTLPQGGRAASTDNIHQSARLAEELGYSHLWANDHIVAAEGQKHPSPFMFDPLLSLATAAAVTTDIGLGC